MSSSRCVCPHCQAALNINNPELIGKQVRCPKCSQPFVVSPQGSAPPTPPVQPTAPPPAAAPSDPFGLPVSDDPFGGSSDPFATGNDDPLGLGNAYDTNPMPAASPAAYQTQVPQNHARKGGGSSVNWTQLAISGGAIVGGVVLLVILGSFLWPMIGGSSNVVDMRYLPQNTEALVYVDISAVASTSTIKEQLESPQYAGNIRRMEQETGLTIADLSSLTVGLTKLPEAGGEPNFVGVLRLSKSFDDQKLAGPGVKEEQVGGSKFFSRRGTGICLVNSRTLVFGTTDLVRSAIASGTEHRFEQFDFVNNWQHAYVAWVPSDRSVLKQFSSPPAFPLPGNIQTHLKSAFEVLTGNLNGFAFGANFSDSELDLDVQVLCDTSDASSKLSTAVNGLITEGKSLYEAQRQNLAAMGEAAEVADKVINSVSASYSGNAMSLNLTVPQGDTLKQAMKSSPLPGFGRMFNMGGGAANRGIPGAAGARPGGSGTVSLADRNKLRELVLGLHNFHAANGSLPPSRKGNSAQNKGLSWRVHLLPYINQRALYDQFKLNEPWDSPHNRRLLTRMPPVFKRFGSRAGPGKANILGIDMPSSAFANNQGVRFRDFRDGMANTGLLVIVNDNLAVEWTRPGDYRPPTGNLAQGLYSDPGSNITAMAFADSSIHNLTKTTIACSKRSFKSTTASLCNYVKPVRLRQSYSLATIFLSSPVAAFARRRTVFQPVTIA